MRGSRLLSLWVGSTDHPHQLRRDLRHNRVSESPQSVHPSGYPCSHSTHVGFRLPPSRVRLSALDAPRPLAAPASGVGYILTASVNGGVDTCPLSLRAFHVSSFSLVDFPALGVGHIATAFGSPSIGACWPRCVWPFQSRLLAVGHNPHSVSSVEGADGASWNNDRPDGVALCFQVRSATVEFHRNDARHILANDPSGPDSFNNGNHCRPEEAVISRACPLPGETEWMAGKSSREKRSPCVAFAGEGAHVVMDWHVGPVFPQYPLCVWFALAEGDRSESSPPCGEGKPSDPAEQVNVCSLLIHAFPDSETANKGLVPTSLPRRGTTPALA
jgi:hypothetical protein